MIMYNDVIDIEWWYNGFKAMMTNMAMVTNVWVHIFFGMISKHIVVIP